MSALIKRLRDEGERFDHRGAGGLILEAATEIENLSSKLGDAEKRIDNLVAVVEAQHAARNVLAGDINLGMTTRIKELEGRLGECQKYWDDEKRRYDATDKAFHQVCDERDALSLRLDASVQRVREALETMEHLRKTMTKEAPFDPNPTVLLRCIDHLKPLVVERHALLSESEREIAGEAAKAIRDAMTKSRD